MVGISIILKAAVNVKKIRVIGRGYRLLTNKLLILE
jgi:hypothetical protein